MNSNSCPDCGPARTNHALEYSSVLLAWLFLPFDRVGESIRRKILAPILLPLHLDRLALPLFRLLATLRLGTINEKLDEQNSLRAKALWETAGKLGIKIHEFRLFGRPLETFVAQVGNQFKFFYEMPRPKKALSGGYWWMDDKPTMRKIFAEKGIPVASGGSFFWLNSALKFFERIGGEVIIKPSHGSRSRHTFVHIRTNEQFKKAFKSAKQLSPFVVVEQQLDGLVYRGSVIGGKLAAVISRNPPTVTGDGAGRIRDLVAAENRNPNRANGIFHTIPLDSETKKELARQNLTEESVPNFGQLVYLSDKVSRGVGAITVDVTDTVHEDNIALFEKIARVLDDSVVGIDFIVNDISKSWKAQKLCGVIECNSAPFLDLHHYPYKGLPRPVSMRLWQLIFRLPALQPAAERSAESIRQSA